VYLNNSEGFSDRLWWWGSRRKIIDLHYCGCGREVFRIFT